MNYYLVNYQEQPTYQFPNKYSKVIEAANPKDAVAGIEGTYVINDVRMIVNPEGTYTILKNHLHNTLLLTKADIRQMCEEAIESIVERRLDVFLEYNDGIQRVIENAIREKSYSAMFWGSDKTSLDEQIQNKIAREITNKLLKEIGLDVKVKRKTTHVELPTE